MIQACNYISSSTCRFYGWLQESEGDEHRFLCSNGSAALVSAGVEITVEDLGGRAVARAQGIPT
jgi:hypothetical protein